MRWAVAAPPVVRRCAGALGARRSRLLADLDSATAAGANAVRVRRVLAAPGRADRVLVLAEAATGPRVLRVSGVPGCVGPGWVIAVSPRGRMLAAVPPRMVARIREMAR